MPCSFVIHRTTHYSIVIKYQQMKLLKNVTSDNKHAVVYHIYFYKSNRLIYKHVKHLKYVYKYNKHAVVRHFNTYKRIIH